MRWLIWLGRHRLADVIFLLAVLLVAWISPPRVLAIAILLVIGVPLGFFRLWALYMRDRRRERSPL
jgi:Flp pilus assembly protein TadB